MHRGPVPSREGITTSTYLLTYVGCKVCSFLTILQFKRTTEYVAYKYESNSCK